MNTANQIETDSGKAPSVRTPEQISRMKQERFYCEDCGRSHHIFNFGPGSTRKIAVCGRAFPLIQGE